MGSVAAGEYPIYWWRSGATRTTARDVASPAKKLFVLSASAVLRAQADGVID